MFRLISRVLVRAPLLAVEGLGREVGEVFAEPLAEAALRLANPELAGQLKSRKAARALGNYARRAAFR